MTSCYSNALFQDQDLDQEDVSDRWKQLNAELQQENEQEEREKVLKQGPREVFAQHMSKILFPEHAHSLHQTTTPHIADETDGTVYISTDRVAEGHKKQQQNLERKIPTEILNQPKQQNTQIENKVDQVGGQPIKTDQPIKNKTGGKKNQSKKKKNSKSSVSKTSAERTTCVTQPVAQKSINVQHAHNCDKNSQNLQEEKQKLRSDDQSLNLQHANNCDKNSQNLQEEKQKSRPDIQSFNAQHANNCDKNSLNTQEKQKLRSDIQSLNVQHVYNSDKHGQNLREEKQKLRADNQSLNVHNCDTNSKNLREKKKKIRSDSLAETIEDNFFGGAIFGILFVLGILYFAILFQPFWPGLFVHQPQQIIQYQKILPDFSPESFDLQNIRQNLEQKYNSIFSIVSQYFNFEFQNQLQKDFQLETNDSNESAEFSALNQLLSLVPMNLENYKNGDEIEMPEILTRSPQQYQQELQQYQQVQQSFLQYLLQSLSFWRNLFDDFEVKIPYGFFSDRFSSFFSFFNPFSVTKSVNRQFAELQQNYFNFQFPNIQSLHYTKNNFVKNSCNLIMQNVNSLLLSTQRSLVPSRSQFFVGVVGMFIFTVLGLFLWRMVLDFYKGESNVDGDGTACLKSTSPGLQKTGLMITTPVHSHCSYNLRSRCQTPSTCHKQTSQNQSISFAPELKQSNVRSSLGRNKPENDLTDTATTRIKQSKRSQKRTLK